MNSGDSWPVDRKWYSAIEAPVKAAKVSLRPWCLTGRLGSIYMAGNSLGGMAEAEDWTRCSYIWSSGLYGLFSAMNCFLLVYIYYLLYILPIQAGPEFTPSITLPLPVVRPYSPPAAPEPMVTLLVPVVT